MDEGRVESGIDVVNKFVAEVSLGLCSGGLQLCGGALREWHDLVLELRLWSRRGLLLETCVIRVRRVTGTEECMVDRDSLSPFSLVAMDLVG